MIQPVLASPTLSCGVAKIEGRRPASQARLFSVEYRAHAAIPFVRPPVWILPPWRYRPRCHQRGPHVVAQWTVAADSLARPPSMPDASNVKSGDAVCERCRLSDAEPEGIASPDVGEGELSVGLKPRDARQEHSPRSSQECGQGNNRWVCAKTTKLPTCISTPSGSRSR